MKGLLLSLMLLFTVNNINCLYAQNSLQLSDIELVNLGDGQLFGHRRDADKTAINGKTRIITGVTTEYIDAEFHDGYATGKWEYHRNNKLYSYATYENGYMDGEFAELNQDGTPKKRGFYKNGKKEGEWDDFYSDGEKKQTEQYKDDGLIKRITYYTNGNIEMERNFLNGKENGIEKRYTLEGDLKTEKNYVNGKQVDKQVQHYTSNLADYIQTSNYNESGKLDGDYSEIYTESGETKQKGKYKNGKKEGLWITGSPSGGKTKEENYENNILTGYKVTEKGQDAENSYYTEITYFDKDGKKTGEYTQTWDKNKAVKTKGKYINGRQDGKWIYGDKNGKIYKEDNYENGKYIDSKKIE